MWSLGCCGCCSVRKVAHPLGNTSSCLQGTFPTKLSRNFFLFQRMLFLLLWVWSDGWAWGMPAILDGKLGGKYHWSSSSAGAELGGFNLSRDKPEAGWKIFPGQICSTFTWSCIAVLVLQDTGPQVSWLSCLLSIPYKLLSDWELKISLWIFWFDKYVHR